MITAALIFGPGSLTINTKLGAGYEFAMLWVLLVAVLFMSTFTAMSTRIGLVIDDSLIGIIRSRYGSFLAVLIGVGIFLATASFQAGNAVGAGVAFAELFDSSAAPWVLFFSALAGTLLFFKSFYRILEKIMIGLVLLMLVSFLLTLIISRPDLMALLHGLVPGLPAGSEYLTVALLASSFSIVGAFYQSYLVREKGWVMDDSAVHVRESRNGIILLGLLSSMVMICAGAVLYEKDISVNTASDLGLALEPLFGPFTSTVFMIGFFAASFSSLLGNATIGGAILSDALGLGGRLEEPATRIAILGVMLIGAAVALYFGRLPLELIVVAQGITVLIVPAAAFILLILSGSEKVMGDLKNGTLTTILGWLGMLLLLIMIGFNVKYLFFS